MCVTSSATGATKFAITDTKMYAPVLTLLTQDTAKLMQQLKLSFKKKQLARINISQK